MPGRKFSSNSYRYGLNGQEKDDEINGIEGAYTSAEYWEYDSRLGRRWNVDPVVHASWSSYACFKDNPVFHSDVKGNYVDYEKRSDKRAARKEARHNKEFAAKLKGLESETSTTYKIGKREDSPTIDRADPTPAPKVGPGEVDDKRGTDLLHVYYSVIESSGSSGPIDDHHEIDPTESGPLFDYIEAKDINKSIGNVFEAEYDISPGAILTGTNKGYPDKVEILSGENIIVVENGVDVFEINPKIIKNPAGFRYLYTVNFDKLYDLKAIKDNKVTIRITSNKAGATAYNFTITSPEGKVVGYTIPVNRLGQIEFEGPIFEDSDD